MQLVVVVAGDSGGSETICQCHCSLFLLVVTVALIIINASLLVVVFVIIIVVLFFSETHLLPKSMPANAPVITTENATFVTLFLVALVAACNELQ